MNMDVPVSDLQGNTYPVLLEDVPDNCPICHRHIVPRFLAGLLIKERHLTQIIFRCANQNCQEAFIGNYILTPGSDGNRMICLLDRVAPIIPTRHDFCKTIQDLSPGFVTIYNEALHAESQNLTEIVGIGLRKSLEFLIKDFAIKENPMKTEQIKKTLLGNCINDYISDVNIKECAKRAAWLGNDETHYIRKWEGKDVNDLKLLIKLTVNWIENVLLTQQYMADMTNS